MDNEKVETTPRPSACGVCVVSVVGERKFVGRLEVVGQMVELAWSADVEVVDMLMSFS